MIRAVVHRDLEIHYREARQKPIGSSFYDSLFDSGNKIARDCPSKHFVCEFEFSASRQRLHANPAVAKLAMPASLFLMTALDVRSTADGFAIRNLGGFQFDVHAVAFLQPADDHLAVLLAAAGEQELLRLRIAIETQRLVLFENPLDTIAQPVL